MHTETAAPQDGEETQREDGIDTAAEEEGLPMGKSLRSTRQAPINSPGCRAEASPLHRLVRGWKQPRAMSIRKLG